MKVINSSAWYFIHNQFWGQNPYCPIVRAQIRMIPDSIVPWIICVVHYNHVSPPLSKQYHVPTTPSGLCMTRCCSNKVVVALSNASFAATTNTFTSPCPKAYLMFVFTIETEEKQMWLLHFSSILLFELTNVSSQCSYRYLMVFSLCTVQNLYSFLTW